MSGFFAAVAALQAWKGHSVYVVPLFVALVFLGVTSVKPDLLAPLNRAWMKLAEILNRIVSPIVMGIVFFGIFTPMGWVMRRFGRDPLRRTFDTSKKSYWIDRNPAGPNAEDLHNQF